MTTQTASTGTELSAMTEARLDLVRNFQDAAAVFADLGFSPVDDETDGIRSLDVIKDKATLIGTPFLALRWRFNEGDMGTFVSVECVTEDGKMFVINDGSTGIRDQFLELTQFRADHGHPAPQAGRMVRGGLRASNYTFEDPKTGKPTPATTYYVQF